MTTLSLAHSQSFAVPARRIGIMRVPLIFWNSFLLAVVAVLGICYLIQVNLTMSRGYQIRETEQKVEDLKMQARSGQIKLSEMETVGNLTALADSLGLVPVGKVEYVTKPTSGVAMR